VRREAREYSLSLSLRAFTLCLSGLRGLLTDLRLSFSLCGDTENRRVAEFFFFDK
jgi:hypothetical protein